MRVLRALGLAVVVSIAALWALRAATVFAIPYQIWWLMREGGYPVWAQTLGAAIFAAAIGFLVYRSIIVAKRRGY